MYLLLSKHSVTSTILNNAIHFLFELVMVEAEIMLRVYEADGVEDKSG